MGKKNKKDRKDDRRGKEFQIPEQVKDLMKLNYKKFKKKNKEYYNSKKELKNAYYAQVIDLLPAAIALFVKYGHVPAVQEIREPIFEKICDKDFVEYLIKYVKKENEFDNMILLPTIIYQVINEANAQAAGTKEEGEEKEGQDVFDLTDLIELSHLILKKKIKKLVKAGVDENLAFDVLSIIPDPEILVKNPQYRIREFLLTLYARAKTKEIPFNTIMSTIFKDNEKVESVILFVLLERKEKMTGFSDSQKKLFADISNWAFDTLESMKKDDIYEILKNYAEIRNRDDMQKKDSARRVYISSLPEDKYGKILKVVERICSSHEDWKKFF